MMLRKICFAALILMGSSAAVASDSHVQFECQSQTSMLRVGGEHITFNKAGPNAVVKVFNHFSHYWDQHSTGYFSAAGLHLSYKNNFGKIANVQGVVWQAGVAHKFSYATCKSRASVDSHR